MFRMTAFEERSPDVQYRTLLQNILDHGTRTETQQETDAVTLMGPPPMRFRLAEGIPLITERNMNPKPSERLPVTIWQQAIGELFAFINGVRTQAGLEEFGCSWWSSWVTEKKCAKRELSPGDLGPGSYGGAFHDFPMPDGGSFNQFAEVLEEIRAAPHLRTHFISPWIPFYIPRRAGQMQKVVVAPCHGWIHLRIIEGKLTLHMMQRSGDVPVGVPSNMIQYAALTLALAHFIGVEAYEYVHSISDAHIYVNQMPAVETMLSREPRRLPTLAFDTSVPDLFSVRREHFTLSDYEPHPGIAGIPVAI
jgi:thymidylate synthase